MDGYNVSEDVIKYIANNIKSNIRELEGAFNRLNRPVHPGKTAHRYAFSRKEAIKDIISPGESRKGDPRS